MAPDRPRGVRGRWRPRRGSARARLVAATPIGVPLHRARLEAWRRPLSAPGTWHQPHTGESHSFHYTLSLASISSWRILYPLIQMAMMHHPEWRRDLRFLEKAATADDSEEAVVGRVLKQFREMLAKTNPREVLDLYRGIELLPEAIRELLRANH